MASSSKNIRYLPGVDHLRAFASALIVLYHGTQVLTWATFAQRKLPKGPWFEASPFNAIIVEGHTSVALFMVLSGFIFTYGATERAGVSIHYGRFLWNRFLRTYPLFLVLLVLGMAAVPKSVTLDSTLYTLFGLASFTPNAVRLMPFSGMFWTLAVEWHFYLIFPFLLEFLRESPLKNALALLAIALVGRGLAYANGADCRDLSYFTIVGRIDQFVLGMLAAFYIRNVSMRVMRFLFIPATLLVCGSLLQFNRMGGWPTSTPFKLLWTTWEGLMWAFFSVSYLAVASSLPRLVDRALCSIGVLSYSVYLWHYPMLQAVVARDMVPNLVRDPQHNALLNSALFALPLIWVFSALSFYVVERPFMKKRVHYLRLSVETGPTAGPAPGVHETVPGPRSGE